MLDIRFETPEDIPAIHLVDRSALNRENEANLVNQLREENAIMVSLVAWDAALLAFERRAWVDTMLNNPNGPNLEQYLSTQMNEEV